LSVKLWLSPVCFACFIPIATNASAWSIGIPGSLANTFKKMKTMAIMLVVIMAMPEPAKTFR
jgi:hypothetical protein